VKKKSQVESQISFMLPRYNDAIIRFIREAKEGFWGHDEILGQISLYPEVHRGLTRQVSEPAILETRTNLMSVDLTFDHQHIRETNVEEFGRFVWSFSEDAKAQMKTKFFQEVSQAVDAVGNVINVGGMTIWNAYMETLRQWDIQFDEDGNPLLDDIGLYDSRTQKQITVKPSNAEEQKELDELIEFKREEFLRDRPVRRITLDPEN
jgi:hypothetical protein